MKRLKTILNNLSKDNIISAIKGNLKTIITKLVSYIIKDSPYVLMKRVVDIQHECPRNCKYVMRCCGCDIYSAAYENKKCNENAKENINNK